MQWWCTAVGRPWTWQWIPYPGIWIATLLPILGYFWRVGRHPVGATRRQKWLFVGGMLSFWLATDWPLGALGAGYLASAHMAQFMIYAFIAAPLLLLGIPEWMAWGVLRRLRLTRAVTALTAAPAVSGLIFNVLMIASHTPAAVDGLRVSELGSFLMDAVWLIAGFVLWMPVIAPMTELRMTNPLGKIAYLFLASSVVPMVPGAFLTFTPLPLYEIYELAPRVGSMSARADQQIAGLIMKVGAVPLVWSTIAVIWFRWVGAERRETTG